MARLFFDCDTGIDDSVALLYLLSRPDVDVVGIASTAGNIGVEMVTANNLAWLQLCGRSDIPVYTGAANPLAVPLTTTEDTHGPRGVGYAELPPATVLAHPDDAADAWIRAAEEYPGELVGLVTGPLTALATAIRRDPGLPPRLARLVIMGGAFHVHGNTTPVAEWNVWVDPEAAAEVFAAFGHAGTVRPIVCALDVTERVAMTPGHLVRLAAAAGSTPAERLHPDDPPGRRSVADNVIVRHLTDALRFYFEFHHANDEGYLAHLHDPFAALVALKPERFTTRPARVDVELTGRLTRGMTVADERGMTGTPNAHIVTSVDVDAVFDEILGGVARLASEVNVRNGRTRPRSAGRPGSA